MTAEVAAMIAALSSILTWMGSTLLARRSEIRRRLDGLETRELVLHDYINVLRQHIADGKPPPPPPWPAELTRGATA